MRINGISKAALYRPLGVAPETPNRFKSKAVESFTRLRHTANEAKEASDQQRSGSLFGSIFMGPLIGTMIGRAIGASQSEAAKSHSLDHYDALAPNLRAFLKP